MKKIAVGYESCADTQKKVNKIIDWINRREKRLKIAAEAVEAIRKLHEQKPGG